MYIAIDLGTTGCKCIGYDDAGISVAEFNEEYSLITNGSYIEQDANVWWELVKKGIRTVIKTSGVSQVTAIAASTQGISYVPVDRNGKPLCNAVSWLDQRAVEESNLLEQEFGKETIFQKTGKKIDPAYTLPQLMWFMKNKPDLYEKTYKFLLPLDFLHMQLTGVPMTDYTMASGTLLFDLKGKKWDDQLLAFSGLDPSKLPEVGCMGDFVGHLLPEVATELGIEGNASVYLGGQDQKLAAIGAGISKDACTVSFGTATAVTVQNPNRALDEKMRFPSFVLNDDTWVFESSIGTTGATVRWLSSILHKSYQEMNELAKQSTKGSGGVKFSTEITNGTSITGLTLATKDGDIVRALYEDICTRIHGILRQMNAPSIIKVFGGGAKSDVWCKILAETTGATVCVLDTAETACRGAAVLASGGKISPSAIVSEITPN